MNGQPRSPAENELALRDIFLPVRDAHERLAFIAEACAGPGIAVEDRREQDLVLACVSPVWLRGTMENGVLRWQWDAASPLVRGLVGLVCGVYQGCRLEEIAAHPSTILGDLGLDRQLSPTRLRGLGAVELRIRGWGAGCGQVAGPAKC